MKTLLRICLLSVYWISLTTRCCCVASTFKRVSTEDMASFQENFKVFSSHFGDLRKGLRQITPLPQTGISALKEADLPKLLDLDPLKQTIAKATNEPLSYPAEEQTPAVFLSKKVLKTQKQQTIPALADVRFSADEEDLIGLIVNEIQEAFEKEEPAEAAVVKLVLQRMCQEANTREVSYDDPHMNEIFMVIVVKLQKIFPKIGFEKCSSLEEALEQWGDPLTEPMLLRLENEEAILPEMKTQNEIGPKIRTSQLEPAASEKLPSSTLLSSDVVLPPIPTSEKLTDVSTSPSLPADLSSVKKADLDILSLQEVQHNTLDFAESSRTISSVFNTDKHIDGDNANTFWAGSSSYTFVPDLEAELIEHPETLHSANTELILQTDDDIVYNDEDAIYTGWNEQKDVEQDQLLPQELASLQVIQKRDSDGQDSIHVAIAPPTLKFEAERPNKLNKQSCDDEEVRAPAEQVRLVPDRQEKPEKEEPNDEATSKAEGARNEGAKGLGLWLDQTEVLDEHTVKPRGGREGKDFRKEDMADANEDWAEKTVHTGKHIKRTKVAPSEASQQPKLEIELEPYDEVLQEPSIAEQPVKRKAPSNDVTTVIVIDAGDEIPSIQPSLKKEDVVSTVFQKTLESGTLNDSYSKVQITASSLTQPRTPLIETVGPNLFTRDLQQKDFQESYDLVLENTRTILEASGCQKTMLEELKEEGLKPTQRNLVVSVQDLVSQQNRATLSLQGITLAENCEPERSTEIFLGTQPVPEESGIWVHAPQKPSASDGPLDKTINPQSESETAYSSVIFHR